MKHDALRRSRGAIALMLALSLFVLFGFMALAMDLGRTYVVRTELQNAADAAALAGALELKQDLSGIANAISRAVDTAKAHSSRFSSQAQIDITAANLAVGTCPRDDCMTPISNITTNAQATGQTFLRVQIPSGTMATLFARLMPWSSNSSLTSTSTFGRAIAGRYVTKVTPIGLCAFRDASGVAHPKNEVIEPVPGSGKKELVHFGFRRGMSYNIFDMGNIGGPSTPYLINPIDVYPKPCTPANSSADSTAPFMCSGSSAVVTTTATTNYVYGNTGVSGGRVETALNSRFNIYGNGANASCDPVQSPPDTNIRAFGCTGPGCVNPAADWMTPSRQSMNPASTTSANDYGVLWSYSRAVPPMGTLPNVLPDTDNAYTTLDWADLYPVGPPTANGNFPANTSPYLDPGHTTPPTGRTGQKDRRVLDVAIIDCNNVSGSGSCKVLPVLGVGRFFMQAPAVVNGGPNAKLNLEFAGLINDPIPQVVLYSED